MKQNNGPLHGLPPVADTSCRMLILGSMPGALSLSKREYYGHPRNHFWRLLYAIFGGADEQGGYASPDESYEARLEFALRHGVALWDVLAACEREGSLDTAIRKPEANDFATFYVDHPAISSVFFNGQAAGELYRKHVLPKLKEFGAGEGLRYESLPSSSPARTMTLEAKLEYWRSIGQL